MVEDDAGAGPPSARFDRARLAEISDGEIAFEHEIAGEYLAQAWGLIEEATRALEVRDATTLARIAHTLKGSSRTIGAEGVAELAAELEIAASSSTQGTAPLLARVLACLVATERELDRTFGTDRYRKAA
jgi:HPt (histidine-containing phosphotransfer) domain-containing protein